MHGLGNTKGNQKYVRHVSVYSMFMVLIENQLDVCQPVIVRLVLFHEHRQKNDLQIHAEMWVSLKNVMLSTLDTKPHIVYYPICMKYPE